MSTPGSIDRLRLKCLKKNEKAAKSELLLRADFPEKIR